VLKGNVAACKTV